jgi:hypothetical protein
MAITSEIGDGLTEMETDFPAIFIWNQKGNMCLAGVEERVISTAFGRQFATVSFGLPI